MNDPLRGSRVLLLSRIPASRKSTFGRWLEENRGFLHLDVETDGVLERHRLRPEWDSLFAQGPDRLLARLNGPTVIDWGFPPHCLPFIRSLVAAGVQPWWFGGDRGAAKQAFMKRGTGSLGDFREQMIAIEASWRAIEEVFTPNILHVIEPGPTYMEPERIAEKILA